MKTMTIALIAACSLSLVACTKAPKQPPRRTPDPRVSNMTAPPPPRAMERDAPHPTSPPPGACAGGLRAPVLACAATDTAVTCRLTDPCMGRLKLTKPDNATLSTIHHHPLGTLKLTPDGRGLTTSHKAPAGTALRVHLSFAIRNVPAQTPYTKGHKGQHLAGVKDARKEPHSYLANVRVPGAPKPRPAVLVPGKSIGPVKLGMDRPALKKTGLKVRLHPSGQMGNNVLLVGDYSVVLTAGRVSSIEYNLSESAGGLKIGTKVLAPATLHAAVAKAMPACGKLEVRIGGSLYRCDGGRLLVKMGGPVSPAIVQVQIFDKPLQMK